MRRLSWLITLPLMVVAVVFAVVNQQTAQVNLWPFDIQLEAPLFLIVLLSIFVGFILGGIASWMAATRKRRRAKGDRARLRNLEQEVQNLQRVQQRPALPASPGS